MSEYTMCKVAVGMLIAVSLLLCAMLIWCC